MMIRKTACGIVIVMCLVWTGSQAAAETKVFLLGGQSNMDGWALTSELPAPYNTSQSDVMFWSNDSWAILQGGFGTASGYFGPEVTFGYRLNELFPDDDIYLVKYSPGGTALADEANQWTPNGSGWAYNNFLATAQAAFQDLQTRGLNPVCSGMIWMQGETDCANSTWASNYAANLTNLIGCVRSDLATPNLPFVTGRIMSCAQYPGYGWPSDVDWVRTAQATVPAEVGYADWVDTDDLGVYPYGGRVNPGHYDAQGQVALGARFADAIGQIIAPTTVVASEDFSGCTPYQRLDGQGSGSGWSGDWTAPYTWANSAQTHVDGDKAVAVTGACTGGGEEHALLYRMLSSAQDGIVYFSVRVKKLSDDSDPSKNGGTVLVKFGGDNTNDNLAAGIGIGAGNVFEATLSGETVLSTETYTAGEYVTLVGKLSYSGSSATLDMWVNPTGVETGEIYLTVTSADAGFSSVNCAWLATWNEPALGYYDDIVLGAAWTDVAVPEPATMSLLTLGGLGALIRRKR